MDTNSNITAHCPIASSHRANAEHWVQSIALVGVRYDMFFYFFIQSLTFLEFKINRYI